MQFTSAINHGAMNNHAQNATLQHSHFKKAFATRRSFMRPLSRALLGFACIAATTLQPQASDTNLDLEIPQWTTEDFYAAIDKDDVKSVQEYLSDTKRATKEFLSYYLLDYALEHERNQIAQLMIEAGAGVDTFSAVKYENVPILEEMLKRGIPPLGASLAAERGNTDLVVMLLDHGEGDLNTEGAVRNGHLDAVKLLLDHGAEPAGLVTAIALGHKAVAQLLLDSGANPNELTRFSGDVWRQIDFPSEYTLEYLSPLHYAVLIKSLDLVNALLEAGADPNIFPSANVLREHSFSDDAWPTVLQTAQDPEWGDKAITQILKKNGAILDVSNDDEDAKLVLDLYDAAEAWNYEEVARLLKLGATPTGFGSFFYEMSERYDPKIIQAFVEAGADPNVFDLLAGGPMYTPTALTLWNGDIENFKRFVEAGAEISETLFGWYMKIAHSPGLSEAIEILWKIGHDRQYEYYRAPFDLALLHDVEAMLAKGARPVGLRTAVGRGRELEVKLLLEAGADPNQPSERDERTILEIAMELDNEVIVNLLEQADAED
ncbi:MAG: hypothetical protein F4227_08510 [Gammaproteobacteria bacterium]|nr:hypothetical protein [Gammaproteobacteria bacterium]MYF02991.1 hypothetical protein [Gammaproteobacteria bacterium]